MSKYHIDDEIAEKMCNKIYENMNVCEDEITETYESISEGDFDSLNEIVECILNTDLQCTFGTHKLTGKDRHVKNIVKSYQYYMK